MGCHAGIPLITLRFSSICRVRVQEASAVLGTRVKSRLAGMVSKGSGQRRLFRLQDFARRPQRRILRQIKSGPSMALRRAYGARRAPPCTLGAVLAASARVLAVRISVAAFAKETTFVDAGCSAARLRDW